MKPTEMKLKFVRLRAEGRSFHYIAERLHVSRNTCSKWDRELAEQIDDLRRAALRELFESYNMMKEARIRQLGETLKQVDEALSQIDFTTIDPARLLELKLKYMQELKSEYVGGDPAPMPEDMNSKSIMKAFADLLNRLRAGEVRTEQAREEAMILTRVLKAYETTETEKRLDELELILQGGGQTKHEEPMPLFYNDIE